MHGRRHRPSHELRRLVGPRHARTYVEAALAPERRKDYIAELVEGSLSIAAVAGGAFRGIDRLPAHGIGDQAFVDHTGIVPYSSGEGRLTGFGFG